MSYAQKIYNHLPIFIQNIILNLKAAELYFERYGKKFWQMFEEFERNQWLSSSEMEAWQNERLQRLIEHAYNWVPYYREKMDERKLKPADILQKDDLHKLPILTREDVKQNRLNLLSTRYPKWLLRHGHTSGTTGSPLDFYYDIQTCVVHHVADWRQKSWAGLKYGQPYASLQGRVIVPLQQTAPPFWRKNIINNQLFFSAFHLKDANIPYYLDKLDKDGIRVIEGYPSTIYTLALHLNKHGRSFPLKAVLTSSETLFEHQRIAIEQAFECNIFDFYGMAERTVYASECNRHSGHHLNMDYGITEYLDKDNNPVEPGNLGRIVATSLHNFAMPFIRYQTNDSGALQAKQCSCGRVFPLTEDVTTKSESIITLPDGRLISPSVLTHPFKPMKNIVESQIIQTHKHQLLIKIVKGEAYSDADEAILLSGFYERLGDQIKIQLEYVKSIPRSKRGKFKWVISDIKPQI